MKFNTFKFTTVILANMNTMHNISRHTDAHFGVIFLSRLPPAENILEILKRRHFYWPCNICKFEINTLLRGRYRKTNKNTLIHTVRSTFTNFYQFDAVDCTLVTIDCSITYIRFFLFLFHKYLFNLINVFMFSLL